LKWRTLCLEEIRRDTKKGRRLPHGNSYESSLKMFQLLMLDMWALLLLTSWLVICGH
jgi:hypothetical protein